jgi:GntR family transcriptional regulator
VLESIETMADRIGLPVTLDDYKLEHRPAEEKEAKALSLEPGSPVWVVSRGIRVEDRPVAYLIDILPEDILSADELDLSFTGSMLDFLLRRGTPELLTSRTEIMADTATSEVARSLGIQRNDVLMRFKAYLYASDGRVVDYSFSYFLPGYFRFHVVRRVG